MVQQLFGETNIAQYEESHVRKIPADND